MGRCSPPKSVAVGSYDRASTRKKPKPKAGAVYWVVRNTRTGATSGTKHRKWTSAVAARKRLDLASYRRGQGRPWSVEKRTG